MENEDPVIKAINNKVYDMFRSFISYSIRSVYLKGYNDEDLSQEMLVSILKAYRKFDETINPNFYFYGKITAINRLHEIERKTIRQNYEISISTSNRTYKYMINVKCSEYNLEEEVIKIITYKRLKAAIATLTDEEKDLIYNKYYRKISMAEYASLRHIPYRRCIVFHKRTLDKLKRYMSGDM